MAEETKLPAIDEAVKSLSDAVTKLVISRKLGLTDPDVGLVINSLSTFASVVAWQIPKMQRDIDELKTKLQGQGQ